MTTTWLGIGIVAFATLISSLGPVYMKRGAGSFTLKQLAKPGALLKNYNIILGCAFFGISALIFVIGLRFGELSVLYPLTSLSYIWACLLSTRMLGERMNSLKWLGIITIIIGVALIGLGRNV